MKLKNVFIFLSLLLCSAQATTEESNKMTVTRYLEGLEKLNAIKNELKRQNLSQEDREKLTEKHNHFEQELKKASLYIQDARDLSHAYSERNSWLDDYYLKHNAKCEYCSWGNFFALHLYIKSQEAFDSEVKKCKDEYGARAAQAQEKRKKLQDALDEDSNARKKADFQALLNMEL